MAAEKKKRSKDTPRSPCPVSSALELMGDKWTLLIVRDMMIMGKKHFGDFTASSEGIPTNILAERLRRLKSGGLITRTPYQTNPVRHEYRLTPKGLDLMPVLLELIRWGGKYMPDAHCPTEEDIAKIKRMILSRAAGEM